jgi:hypothetical protein
MFVARTMEEIRVLFTKRLLRVTKLALQVPLREPRRPYDILRKARTN